MVHMSVLCKLAHGVGCFHPLSGGSVEAVAQVNGIPEKGHVIWELQSLLESLLILCNKCWLNQRMPLNPVGQVPKVLVAEAMLWVDNVGAALKVNLRARTEKLLETWRQLVCRDLMQELNAPQHMVSCVACTGSQSSAKQLQCVSVLL